MRFLSTLIMLAGIGYGLYWVNNNHPEIKHKALDMINTGNAQSFEARFTAKQIMEQAKLTLLEEEDSPYAESNLKFHPCLLMQVKFTNSNYQTEEGAILWDLIHGEMILNTQTWEKTHGFSDCMNANADRYEYQILATIAQNNGKADRLTLINALKLEPHLFDAWVDRATKKKLIVRQENNYRIHLKKPRIHVTPATLIKHPLITENTKCNNRIPQAYSSKQVIKAAEAAFGKDFAIRSSHTVFLPVYSITIQNPDGSYQTTHWNALNGKQI